MEHKLTRQDLKTIKELKTVLSKKHKGLVEKIFCYGSRLLSHRQDADFDIIVVTSRKITWEEERKIYADVFRLGLDYDIQFDVKFFSEEEINITHRQMPFLKNVLSYGITI